MARVAVLGGGQLGWMLGLAGIPLDVAFTFLDPTDAASAGRVGDLVVGGLDDLSAARKAAAGAVVVTYEWEGVPASTARDLEAVAPVYPPPRALDVAQDRLVEKRALNALGVPTARFRPVDNAADLEAAVAELGLPAILKTRRGGYDGKGQVLLREPRDLDGAAHAIGNAPCVLEGFVSFDRELSIIAVRSPAGEVKCWPAVENVHREGILRSTRAPAPGLDPALQTRAEAMIRPLLDDLAYVGVCCVELFDAGGELLANEIAPRVHNSGHWTIEGAQTSQFENHVRAILGLPLGATTARGVSAMANCIGVMPDRDAILRVPGAHLHDYGKSPRPRRKLGHVTVTASDTAELDAAFADVLALCDGAGLA